jgi:asparagine synthase (glutamine-hydrolysing)
MVIDLDQRSDQPMWDSDGRYAILFNGEIYNFEDLAKRHKLETRTSSDTEVLLLLYRKFGSAMLPELNGMFAFVIFDRINNDYFVARDRLGIKPLYFYEDPDWLIYASEVPPILDIVGNLPLSEEGIRQYRVLRTFFNGKTAYERIEMFPAGFWALNDKRQRYWDLPQGPQIPPSDDELRALIDDAIKIRTIADVAVGSFLSGGIDSTIVAALSGKPDTWTVGFSDMNEFEWASVAADHIGSHHVALEIDASQFFSALRELTQLRREPLSVPNEVSLYLLSRQIKEKNTVTLSGEGADELFFGYDRIFRWAASCESFDVREFATRYAYAGPDDDLEIIDSVIAPFRSRGSPLDIVAAFFQIGHLHGLLRRLDASTMAASVEARPPFCDYRLVERLAGVPATYRMANDIVKAPLKRIFCNIIPHTIIGRDKVGFPLPLERLFPAAANESATARWLHYCEHEFLRYGAIS